MVAQPNIFHYFNPGMCEKLIVIYMLRTIAPQKFGNTYIRNFSKKELSKHKSISYPKFSESASMLIDRSVPDEANGKEKEAS